MGQTLAIYEHEDFMNPQPFLKPPTPQEISALPNNGKYHSDQKLYTAEKRMFCKSIEELSQYADYVTRGSYDKTWMIKRALYCISNDVSYVCKAPNITAMGNLAYMSLNCSDSTVKHRISLFILRCKLYNTVRRNTI